MATSPLLVLPQVRYDPDATGPRHLLAAVQGVGFTSEPYAEQRLGELSERKGTCVGGQDAAAWHAGLTMPIKVACSAGMHAPHCHFKAI